MARLSQALGTAPINPSDRASAELTQLLARLEQTILRADHDRERRLRASEYERARINKVCALASVFCRNVDNI